MDVRSRPISVLRIIFSFPYCFLWLGELISGTAIIALTSALALEVSAQTNNPGLVALLVALVAVPVLVLSPCVVPVTARFGVQRTLWVSQVVMALATLVVAWCLAARAGGLVPGFVLVSMIGAANAFHVPALFASLGWFVGERRVPQGISSFSVRTVLTWILGPLVVGVIGSRHRGADLAWWSAGALALAVVPTLALHRRFDLHERALRERERLEPGCVNRAIAEGLSDYDLRNVCMLSQAAAPASRRIWELLNDGPVRFLMIAYGLLYAFLGAFSVVLIPWATEQLETTAATATTLVSLRAFSALPGPLVAGRAVRRFGISPVLVVASLLGSGASLAAGLQHRYGAVAIVTLVVYGAVFYVLTTGTFATLTTAVVGRDRRIEGAALFAFVRGGVSVLFVAMGLLARKAGTDALLLVCAVGSAGVVLLARFGVGRRWQELMGRFQTGVAEMSASPP